MQLTRATKSCQPIVRMYGATDTICSATVDRFCCDRMKTAWKNLYIGFGNRDNPRLNQNQDVNVYELRFSRGDTVSFFPVAIDFCPFCGEAIEIADG